MYDKQSTSNNFEFCFLNSSEGACITDQSATGCLYTVLSFGHKESVGFSCCINASCITTDKQIHLRVTTLFNNLLLPVHLDHGYLFK